MPRLALLLVAILTGCCLTLCREDSTLPAHASGRSPGPERRPERPDLVAQPAASTRPHRGLPRGAERPSQLPATAADLRQPPEPLTGSTSRPLADLQSLHDKAVAKTEAQLAKQTKRLAKLTKRQDKLLAKRSGWLADLAQFEADLIQAPLDLAAAEQALAAAEALPAETPEQKQSRQAALKAAKSALKAAKALLAQANSGVKRLTKRLAKLDQKLAKLTADLAATQAALQALAQTLDVQQAPFGFSSLESLQVSGVAHDPQGQPVAHATVLLVDPLGDLSPGDGLEGQLSAAVHWRGFSQADGSFGGALRLPATLSQVDVVVTAAGHQGPYTHEFLREQWGVYAPAARLTVALEALTTLDIELQAGAP